MRARTTRSTPVRHRRRGGVVSRQSIVDNLTVTEVISLVALGIAVFIIMSGEGSDAERAVAAIPLIAAAQAVSYFGN